MRTLIKAIDSLNTRIGKYVGFLQIAIAAIIVYEIIVRSFFHSPTSWVHELSGMLFGAVFLLGAAWVERLDEHVRVDILIPHLRPRVLALLNIITNFLTIGYCSIIIWKGWSAAWNSLVTMEKSTYSTWRPILFPIKFILVIGVVLLLVQVLAKYVRYFHILVTGKELK